MSTTPPEDEGNGQANGVLTSILEATTRLEHALADAAEKIVLAQETQDRIETMATTVTTSANATRWLKILTGVLAVLLLAVGGLALRAFANTDNIAELQGTISEEGLCPIYADAMEYTDADLDNDGEVTKEEQETFDTFPDENGNGDGEVTEAEIIDFNEEVEAVLRAYDKLDCHEVT
jgi:hypothetical protein